MKSRVKKDRILAIIILLIMILGIIFGPIYIAYINSEPLYIVSFYLFFLIMFAPAFIITYIQNGKEIFKVFKKFFKDPVMDDKVVENYIQESLSKDEILDYVENRDIENLKTETFEVYKNVENACNDNNLEELRKYVTDEFYNMVTAQINLLKIKNKQKIVENIEYMDSYLINAFKEENKIYFDMDIALESKEYIKDIETNEIVEDNKTNYNHYRMTFVKSINDIEKKCPNCGSKIIGEETNICNYCNTRVILNNHKLVLSKITLLKKNKALK